MSKISYLIEADNHRRQETLAEALLRHGFARTMLEAQEMANRPRSIESAFVDTPIVYSPYIPCEST